MAGDYSGALRNLGAHDHLDFYKQRLAIEDDVWVYDLNNQEYVYD